MYVVQHGISDMAERNMKSEEMEFTDNNLINWVGALSPCPLWLKNDL